MTVTTCKSSSAPQAAVFRKINLSETRRLAAERDSAHRECVLLCQTNENDKTRSDRWRDKALKTED